MKEQTPVVKATYKLDTDEILSEESKETHNFINILAAIDEYEATTDCYIIDLICRQENLRASIPLSDIEYMIVDIVLAAFGRMKFYEIIRNEDRDGLKKALLELYDVQEIRRSERLGIVIGVVLARLDRKKEEFDFIDDLGRLMADWALLVNYSGYSQV